jgi:diguanylate cyclase (GGDEF)-like protein/PAS domain S-box-containing protein
LYTEIESLEARARHEAPHSPIIHETFEALTASVEELHTMLATVTEQQAALELEQSRLEAERQRYRDLFEFAPDAYLVTDTLGRIHEANRAASDMLNVQPRVLAGRQLLVMVVPDDQPLFLDMLRRLVAGEPVRGWKLRMRQRNGGPVDVAVVVQPVHGASGNVTGIRWLLRDVTAQVAQAQALQASEAALAEANATLEQRVAERTAELRVSEERLRFIAENLDDVFWLTSPDENTILYVSPSYEQLYGRTCQSLYDDPRSYLEAIHPDDRASVQQQVAGSPDQQLELTFRVVRPDGTIRWVWTHAKPIYDAAGQIVHRVGIAKDITARKEHEAQIEALAYKDPLTGLANRRRLFEAGIATFEAAQATGGELALLYLDLDSFKAVNDTWGHDTGDTLLRVVAARLRTCVRPSDLVARLGGDEFAVLLPNTEVEQAVLVAQRIATELAQSFVLRGYSIDIGCSVGIATLESVPQSFSQFVTQADEAMYRAKTTDCFTAVYGL